MDEARIYQRIGECVVSFQWLENLLRQIGWFILDPSRNEWPPTALRKESLEALIDKVQQLFVEFLPRCQLPRELEAEFRDGFRNHAKAFHRLRRTRDLILHSAYIEFKAGGEPQAILRSDPRLEVDSETGIPHSDEEVLSEHSFEDQLREIARIGFFLNRCHIQLIHSLPCGGEPGG